MIKVCIALALAIVGVLMKGLLHLGLTDAVLVFMIPFVFLHKLLGNRPHFFVYAAMLGAFSGASSFFYGYIIGPILYYWSIWGWGGVVAGVVAALLLPLEFFLFLGVAFFKGGAAVYIGNFIGGICFGISGGLLFAAAASQSPWSWLSRRKEADVAKEAAVT